MPSGTVTFLFTDLEGSTRLWELYPALMRAALARHDAILLDTISDAGGSVFSTGGDGFAAAFPSASSAVHAALTAQQTLQLERWAEETPLRVRMGVHSGEAEERDGNYFGSCVNRAARLMSAAHGGQIVLSDVTAALLEPTDGVGLVDLGLHHLRGLMEPSRVFAVKADGLARVDQPLATADVAVGNLPRPMTEWFGPVGELRRRAAELSSRRLVTLTGPGGVGKTRLAIEAGGLVTDEYPDGVWFVELAGVSDPTAIESAVSSALGVVPQDGLSLLGSVLQWLERRRLLLILDNCEHLLSAVADLVTAITQANPSVTVLATSREPLGVDGERVLTVPSLERADGVELFCDRAIANDDSNAFDDAERETIAAICTRLDGIPLAIELAAARARALGVDELSGLLDDRFRTLRGSGRGRMERHQTLRAAIDWSYQLLNEAEQTLFDRLSVFADGFDLAAVTTICTRAPLEEGDAIDVLSALVDKSLVTVTRSGTRVRYRLLETLRQYGEECLGRRGDSAELHARHLAYYVSLADQIATLWNGTGGSEALELVNREWANLRTALGAALETHDLASADAILDATFGPASLFLRFEHGEWAEQVITVAQATNIAPRPEAFGYAAAFAWRGGQYDHALDLARRGIAAASSPEYPGTLLCWASLVQTLAISGAWEELRSIARALHAVGSSGGAEPYQQLSALIAFIFIAVVIDRSAIEVYDRRAEEIASTCASAPIALVAFFVRAIAARLAEPPHDDRALDFHVHSLQLAISIGATNFVCMNTLSIAGLKLRHADHDVGIACREALTACYDARAFPHVNSALNMSARYLADAGAPEPCFVIFGHLESHAPGVLATAKIVLGEGVMTPLPEAPEADHLKASGARMDRHEIVAYTLSQLDRSLEIDVTSPT
jgi:predicted ATPase/class 3 adenylate cyclase